MKVEFVNNTDHKIVAKEFDLLIGCVARELRLSPKTSVGIFFVESKEIKKLNRETRKINKITDVLSFPMQEKNSKYEKDADGDIALGDVVICPDYALKNAIKMGRKAESELIFLAVHGMLHLCGYDHDSDDDHIKMDKVANKIINCFEKL
jgi:probable rRNA maturation factor